MLFRLVRPMRREGSRNEYFRQRIPADVKPLAVGLSLSLPVGEETATVAIAADTKVIKVSLRTAEPSEVKIRQAKLAAHLEGIWRHLRAAGPAVLTNKQAVALAGKLYRGWAEGEGRERTVGMVHVPVGEVKPGEAPKQWQWVPDNDAMDGEPEVWAKAAAFLGKLTERDAEYRPDQDPEGKKRPLEIVFGRIIDRLLSREGIVRITAESRELLLNAFHSAMLDAMASRERNAAGDYRPDPNAERFPEFQPTDLKPREKPQRSPAQSLSGLFEAWWAEAKVSNRTVSTYDSYGRTIRQLRKFLGHDDASILTTEDIVRFKDQRIAEGVSPKTVRDSDIAALRSVFSWGVANRRMTSNPADGIKVVRLKKVRTRERGFTAEEAKALLRHAAGHEQAKRENAKTAAAKRWAPWLCAYTGARVGEIVQLRKQDVRCADGVWIITITPEAGTVKDKEAREVVLHGHLVELGFTEFVERSKAGYLFLNAAIGDDIRGTWRAVKNRLVDFAREVVTDKMVAPNHGWRHCFKTIGREVGIEDSVLDGICGHAPSSVGGSYGAVSVAAQSRAFAMFPRFEL